MSQPYSVSQIDILKISLKRTELEEYRKKTKFIKKATIREVKKLKQLTRF